MSHGLDAIGSKMVSSRGLVPWHAHPNCTVVELIQSIPEAMELGGTNFIARKAELFLSNGQSAGMYALVREDTGAILSNKSVGVDWTVLQPLEAFMPFQPFLDQKAIELDTCGALNGGSIVWMLAKLTSKPFNVGTVTDTIEKFLLISNPIEYGKAVRVGFTPIRVVCNNTLAMAHDSDASKLIRFHHSRDIAKNVADVSATINAFEAEFQATEEAYNRLFRKGINKKDVESYVKKVFNMQEKDGKLSTRSANILDEIVKGFEVKSSVVNELLEANRAFEQQKEKLETNLLDAILDNVDTPETVSQDGTLWNAYNAVTRYLSHERGHNPDTALRSLWFGDSFRKNEVALQTALEMAA